MSEPTNTEAAAVEHGEELSRQLTSSQLGMIGIGGAIGTGLFLGSSLAVHAAGPGVILSYAIGAVIALLLMGALSEMAVAHPTAGSFGVYAEIYLNRWSGFVVRYTYWAAQCVAIGGEATAIAIYCQWWFPNTPKWLWVLGFAVALIYVNARSVGSFGSFEYWFAMIKVVAIVLFIVFGWALIIAPRGGLSSRGLSNLTAYGGFLPLGWRGVWMAMVFVIFSYIGTEVIAVTAGEAKNPSSRCAARHADDGRALDPLLPGRHRGGALHRSLESDPARRQRHGQPLRQGLPADRRSGRRAHRELRRHHGGCVQHELQSLSG